MKKIFPYLALALGLYFSYQLLSGPKITNFQPAGSNIICFGDSLTYGTGAGSGRDYPSQLVALINRPVINAGVPGNTTADALARLERDVLSRSPRIVLITLGGNDLKNGVSPQEAFLNLRTIIEAIQARGALVGVGGISLAVWDRGFSAGYRQVCKETGALFIENILDGIIGNDQLMSDRIHPNGDGYAIMAERFAKAIRPYL